MPTVNVLYVPNQGAVHDYHAAEREQLGKLLFRTSSLQPDQASRRAGNRQARFAPPPAMADGQS